MRKLFDLDNPVIRVLDKVVDMIVLSALWLIGCLPVITIVASTTALYYASIKNALDEGTVVRNFVRAYRRDFFQSVLLEVILVIFAVFLYFDWMLINASESVGVIVKVAMALIGFECAAVLSFIPALQARFVLKIPGLIKNAFVISNLHLPTTVLVVLINAIPFAALLGITQDTAALFPVLLLIAPGITGYFNSKLFLSAFEKHDPPETEDGAQ